MDCIFYGGAKSQTWLSDFHFTHLPSNVKCLKCVWLCIRGTSLVAPSEKSLPAMQETWVNFRDQEDTLEKGMATHSSVLAWRTPWPEEPGGLPTVQFSSFSSVAQSCQTSIRVPESDTTERLTDRYVCIYQATYSVRIHCGFTVAMAITELPGTSQACCFSGLETLGKTL